jgi:DNA-binding winged helix-turn-helix (wHTH) protein
MTGNGSERVRFGPFEVDLHTHEFWKYGTKLKLIGQPFEILAVLLSRPGELVTREELRARLWPGETFVDFNHGLNAAVNKLRDVLSDSAEEPRYVETLPRRGYRFIAKIERTAVVPATRTIAAPQVQPSFPSEAPPESAVPVIPALAIERTGTRLWTRYLATAVMLAALAVAIGIFDCCSSPTMNTTAAQFGRETGA